MSVVCFAYSEWNDRRYDVTSGKQDEKGRGNGEEKKAGRVSRKSGPDLAGGRPGTQLNRSWPN